jgi:aspartyl-tRNA(Asn)/glutamyl-tRNA(Gln) amidotransferase subunit C
VSERITKAEVAHVARLARLELTPEELELYSGQLSAVLDLAAQVASLDTAEVPPTAHPVPLENVLRDDVPGACLDRSEVLAQAPCSEDDTYFRVPPILGDSP